MGIAMSMATSVPRHSARTPSLRTIFDRPSMVLPYAEHSGPRQSAAMEGASGLGHAGEQPATANLLHSTQGSVPDTAGWLAVSRCTGLTLEVCRLSRDKGFPRLPGPACGSARTSCQ